jgi:hypothetical protein
MWTVAVKGSAAIVGFDGVLQALQPGGPQLGEERLQRLEALRAHDVEAALALGANGHEAGVPGRPYEAPSFSEIGAGELPG